MGAGTTPAQWPRPIRYLSSSQGQADVQTCSKYVSSLLIYIYLKPVVPPATPIPTLGLALDRLTAQLAKLTASHAANTSALTSLAQQREEVDEREKEMRVMVDRAETKRVWFGEFKEWVEGVAGFLDEKVGMFPRLIYPKSLTSIISCFLSIPFSRNWKRSMYLFSKNALI